MIFSQLYIVYELIMFILPVWISAFDLEPRKLTGTIKYVGKVDSEYIDNRIYVGVKLDDPG